MAGSSSHLHHCIKHSFILEIYQSAYPNAAFLPLQCPLFSPKPFSLCLSYSMPTLLLPQLEVVKVVGVPPAYPPILMANPPLLLLHTWLLPGISTYQVGHGRTTWVVTQLLIFPTSLHSPWSRLSLVTQRWITGKLWYHTKLKKEKALAPAVSFSKI